MAQSKEEIVRPIFEAWGRGEFTPSFDAYDPEMEWGWTEEFPGLAGVYQDREDPNPRLRTWLSGWKGWHVEATDFIEIGDHLVVYTVYRGKGKDSGIEVAQEGAHVFRIRDDKVIRLVVFADRERALVEARRADFGGAAVGS